MHRRDFVLASLQARMHAFRIMSVSTLAVALVACASSIYRHGVTMASPPGSAFVELRGVRIHYRESPGQGSDNPPALLLIHGFGASGESWNDILPLLSQTRHTMRLDLRGFGLSDKPRDSNYSLDEQAELVSGFVEASSHPRLVLVGHSYGGAVAFLSYLKLRDRGKAGRVAGLVFVDAAAYAQDPPFFVAQLRNPFTRFVVENFTTHTWRTRFVLRRLFVDKARVDTERVERYAKYLRLPGAGYAIAKVAAQVVPSNADSLSSQLKTIDIPTQIIWGDMDPAIPLAMGRRLASDIPKSSLEIILTAGHVPHEEQPIRTAQVILRFIEALS